MQNQNNGCIDTYIEVLKAAQGLNQEEKERLVQQLVNDLPDDSPVKRMIVILSANNVLTNSVNFQIGQNPPDLQQIPESKLVQILESIAILIRRVPDL